MTDSIETLKQEFEDFAYIVSHDLNAPLRHLKQFSTLLMNEHADTATDEEKQYFRYMQKALSSLDEMQDSLLTFSRINTRANPYEIVNCEDLVKEVTEERKLFYAESEPVIETGPLPVITADPDQLRLVFYHLIDNAIKFHEEGEKIKCEVSAEDRDNDFLFRIKDNGIGIPARFHEEVFKIFRRLNPDGAYAGTGAGLTFSRKIVNRHNGLIWLDSEPGVGTTVYFTISK